MVALLRIPTDHRQHIGMILSDSQNLLIILDILRKVLLKQHIVDQTALYDRHDRLQLFSYEQIIAALVPVLVDLFHSTAQCRNDPGLLHGLCDILQNAQLNGFLRIVKLIVGAHHDKDHIVIRLPDLPHGLDAVDAGHLDIHDGDIRTIVFRQLDDASAGLGILDTALIAEFFFYDKFQGIDHNSFIIRQHDLIMAHVPLLPFRPVFFL